MISAWIKTILLLPFNVLFVIPALLLYCADYHWTPNHWAWIAIGGILCAGGIFLAVWTMRLFATQGQGTAAPWNPPKKLVVAGPYRHVRNPMISSVLAILMAEALLLNSGWIFGWFALFFIGNTIYFPCFEEKDLENRFGASYLEYKRNVPRWIPRFSAWRDKG